MHLPLVETFGDEVVAGLFSERATVERWLAFERALAEVQAELGVIPAEAAEGIAAAARPERIDLERLRERTRVVGYPILPLLEQLAEIGHWLHFGATTQDVMDTALALALRDALDRLEELGVLTPDGRGYDAEDMRIVEAIVRDEHAVIPIGSFHPRYGTTLSLPSILGRRGVSHVLEPEMSDDEKQSLQHSADRLREAVARLQI
jgi:hypothetical protein